MCTERKLVACEHRTLNFAITIPMHHRYTNFIAKSLNEISYQICFISISAFHKMKYKFFYQSAYDKKSFSSFVYGTAVIFIS